MLRKVLAWFSRPRIVISAAFVERAWDTASASSFAIPAWRCWATSNSPLRRLSQSSHLVENGRPNVPHPGLEIDDCTMVRAKASRIIAFASNHLEIFLRRVLMMELLDASPATASRVPIEEESDELAPRIVS